MLDPKLIRSDLNAVAEQLKKRSFELDVATLEGLESKEIVKSFYSEIRNGINNTVTPCCGFIPGEHPGIKIYHQNGVYIVDLIFRGACGIINITLGRIPCPENGILIL